MSDFESLCLPHYRAVKKLCSYLLGNVGEGEDAAQETFAKALVRLPDLQEVNSVRSWLMSIAYRHSLDRLRARKHRNHVELERASSVQQLDPPHLSLELQEVLQQLSSQERDLLILKHYFGLDYSEIARILEIPTNQVGMKLLRARKAVGKVVSKGELQS